MILAFHITLKGMENGRSPGSDGLTKEFENVGGKEIEARSEA
jgi:hypothetical protein